MFSERLLGIQELNVTLTGMTQKLNVLYSALGKAELGCVKKGTRHMKSTHAWKHMQTP